jgi:Flp pilus assembly protein TadD
MLFVLALLSKAMAISFPLVVILYDLLHHRDRMRGRLPLYAVLLVMAAVFAVLNRQAQTIAVVEAAPLDYRLWTAMYAPLHYTLKTLWPSGLVALYPIESNPATLWPVRALSLLFNLGAIALVIRCWTRRPTVSFGLLASAIVLGPVSGIVMFGSAYAADRYSYLPTAFLMIGFIPTCSEALISASGRVKALTGAALVTAVVMCVSVSLWLMPTWQSSATLWSRVLAIYPESSKARVNLAHAQFASGQRVSDDDEAVAEPMAAEGGVNQPRSFNQDKELEIAAYAALLSGDAERALQLTQTLSDVEMRARLQMAIARQQGDREAVASAGRELLLLVDPYEGDVTFSRAGISLAWAGEEAMAADALSRVRIPTREAAMAWGQLASLAVERKDWDLAESRSRRALAIFPGEHNGARVLSEAHLRRGDEAQAERVLKRARRHPVSTVYTRVYAEVLLASLQAGRGNTAEAERMVQNALQWGRDGGLTAESWNFIGWSAENRKQPGLALRLYREALQTDPTHPATAGNAGYMLMRRGALEEAVQILKRASEAHPEDTVLRANLARVQQLIESRSPNATEDAAIDAPEGDAPPAQPIQSE